MDRLFFLHARAQRAPATPLPTRKPTLMPTLRPTLTPKDRRI